MPGFMVSTSANYHWVRSVHASTNGGNVLKITLRGDSDAAECQFNEAEINVFMEGDADLTERLIAAINGAAQPAEAKEPEVA